MRTWWPLVAVCLGSALFLVDTTVVTVALPDIGRDFGAGLGALQWVPNGYTLVLAVLMLTVGSLADRWGPRATYLAGLVVFGIASLGCGLAANSGELIAARAVQGIGGAGIAVTGFALVMSTYRDRARGTAIGVYFAVNGLGAAIGPMLGGVLTEFWGWRSIFFVNLPVVALTIAITARAVRRDGATAKKPLDPAGMLTFGVAAAALTYGLSRGDWSLVTITSFAVAAAAFAAFVVVERRVPHPLLDPALFRDFAFSSLLACSAASTLVFAALLYLSIWLQSGLGLGPVAAGFALMPLAAASFVTSTVAGKFLHRVAPRLVLAIGVLLGGAGCALQLGLTAESTATSVTAGLVVTGIGIGLAGPAMGAAVAGTLPPDRGGMAAGILTTVRQLGQTLGVAVLGIAFQTGAGSPARGLDNVYLVSAAAAAVTGVLVLVAVRAAGRSGTRPARA
ncbi:MFS transporter [Amycolatopsis sp. CA-230715]|uniref:MFS transporter n=1 Tax=Amycolatopsis sp. CA-230715 TaxID=2745196 RepID=UPI001C026D5D|nr:MFS transporter [Amycolatopsis sp. CA-230715]QWF76735.1 Multidrug resistance protein Stp [Amycolatopsis sp. CA-230715]